MSKLILALLSSAVFFILLPAKTLAFDRATFVSLVNPVRGWESWNSPNKTPLDLPLFQYQEATHSALPITWLLRFDAVSDALISATFKDLTATDSSQMLGAFLEITPKLAQKAGVEYPRGDYLLQPHRVFLSGYTQSDRLKLINTYMQSFFDKFGLYPSTVGAWYIDSYSLNYLVNKYSVLAAVLCDDQYSTDHYRIWGSYLGSPYYPSKYNPLVPASNSENKINLAVVKWAMRDLFNFYGSGGFSSFSVQINDYTFYNLNRNYLDQLLSLYSQKDFNEFTQIVIGLENDYSLKQYGSEIKKVYQLLDDRSQKYNLKFIPLADFGSWFIARYPESSPAFVYKTTDPTGNQPGEVLWYQNPFYRLGLKNDGQETKIIDFRLFHQNEAGPYYTVPNTQKTLYAETPFIIDSVKFPQSALSLPFNLDIDSLEFNKKSWIFSATESGKILTFKPQSLVFEGFSPPRLDHSEVKISQSGNKTIWQLSPQIPFSTSPQQHQANFIKVIGLLLLSFFLFKLKLRQFPKLPFLLGLFSVSIASLTVIKSGLTYPFGLGFWGPNGHDAVFHLSLINSLKQSLTSLQHPQLSGFSLQNYHFGFDYLAALFSRLLNISTLNTYFRSLPLIIAILTALFTYKLLRLWKYPPLAINLALLGIFLTGSLGFLPRLLSGHSFFSGESTFWANQSISFLLNPPFALSLVILLLFLLIFEKTKSQSLTIKNLIILTLLGGLLAQVKIYAFLLLVLALLLQRQFKLVIGTCLFGLLFILPALSLNNSPFIFKPLWFTQTMFAAHDRLNWPRLAQAWQVYQTSGLLLKLLLVNLFALFIFIIGNLGIRLLGLYHIICQKHSLSSQKLASSLILLGLIIPLLFVQQLNPWNTIQFSYYSLFLLTFFTAAAITSLYQKATKIYLKILILILVAVIALPTTIGTLRDYLTGQSAARISFVELRALDFLKRQTPGTVISPLFNSRFLGRIYDPRPLYNYTSTAYISAFSNQKEYLSDTINLDITGFDYQERAKNVQRFYNTTDITWMKQFLQENDITYVYETPINRLVPNFDAACLEKIFDSGEINLYKFNCHGQDLRRS